MKPRLLAAALAVVAAALFLALAQPLRGRALVLGDEYREAREERQKKREELIGRERREAIVRQAMATVSAAPRPSGEAVRHVRKTVVQALDSARLEGVRLSVRPGRPAGGTIVRVSASGPVDRVLQLTSSLAAPGRGVVLENVRLAREGDGLSLDVEALGFAGAAR